MTAYLEQFGTVTLPPALPESDAGTGPSVNQLTPMPWGGQFDGLGDGVAPMPGDKLTYKCRLIGTSTSNLDGLYKAYRLLRGTREKLYRRNGDTTQHWSWARLNECKGVWDYEHIVHMDLNFEFQMTSPCWYSTTTHAYDWHIVGIAPADTLLTTLAESKGAAVKYIDHSGNIDQPAAIFTLTAISTVTSVIINNVTTGYSFIYTNTLAAGDVLVIDTGAMSVKKNGVDDYKTYFHPPTNHEEWMHIAPGENKLTINITGGGRLALEYYAAFA
jgi:hypothetical protein